MKKKYTEEGYPLYEIVVDDTSNTGIRLLSIVGEPAIELKGVAFNENGTQKNYEFQAQEDQQIIIGPALIPNMKILRKDDNGSKYYVVFKPETIKMMVEKFNSQGTNRRINVDHSNTMVDGYILENWIVEDMYYDKSRMYNFDVPIGTWMVSVKIEDQNFWNTEVKELGKFGFSVEGIMGERPMQYSHVDAIDNLSDDEILNLLFENIDIKKKNFDGVQDKYELNILHGLESRGISEDDFDDIIFLDELDETDEYFKDHQFADNPAKKAKRTIKGRTGDYKKYYKYSGPNDEKTRLFCWYLLSTAKLFTQDDLDNLTSALRYDVKEFCGAYNCRHDWKEVIATKKTGTPEPLGASDTSNLREASVYDGKTIWK